ncbi:hypothetical protein [Sphingomonas sediminicola]|nr:hypothetical protein [Sphingomonas sediminicola]
MDDVRAVLIGVIFEIVRELRAEVLNGMPINIWSLFFVENSD